MKTSPELLADILGVLGTMSTKMDSMNSKSASPKKETNVTFGAAGVLGTLLGQKGAAAKMAEDVEKLKTAMNGFNLVRLNQMIDSLKKYNEVSKEGTMSKKVGGWAIAAQDMGKALVYIAGGIGLFAGVIVASGALLGVSPIGVFGFIMGSMIALSMSMIIISGGDAGAEKIAGFLGGKSTTLKNAKADEGRNKKAIQNAKDMGIALMFIAGGIMAFGVVLGLAAAVFGVGALLVPLAIVSVIGFLGLAMIGLAELTTIGDKAGTGTGKNKGKSKDAIQNAKDMGLALMFIAGGVVAFAVGMAIVPVLFKKTSILAAVGEVALIIVGMAALIGVLGLAQRFIEPGIAVAKGIGISLLLLSAGVFVVALTSKVLLEMFKGSKTVTDEHGNKTKERGGPLAAIGNAAAGLGIFGLFVAGLGALLWVMGLPIVSAPIGLGALALIGMSLSLIVTAVAIKKVTDVMKTMDVKTIRTNVSDMVGGVMSGVIEGVMGSGVDKNDDGKISIKEVMQFRRITRVIRMLGSISKTISQFAMGLQAFAKLGEISSLRYEEGALDKDGNPTMKPIIGAEGKIHVVEIAKAIADTFGMFIKSLVESTQGLTRRQSRSLTILGKSLTGDQGLISGVSQFANVLQTFSKFGKEGNIWVPPQYEDEKQTRKVKGTGEAVPIRAIVKNIVDSFGQFVTEMVAHSKEFEIGGRVANQMKSFTEALMGKKRSGIGSLFASDKPGILSGITGFNDVLLLYADYGADGTIPVKDKDGNIIPGKSISVKKVAENMVSGITTFTSSLSTALNGKDLAGSAKEIEKKMGSFTDIVTQFDKMAESQEGIDKLANSLGLLATNMGLLVTNMGPLNTDKLQSLATMSAQHAVTTKGIPISANPVANNSPASSGGQTDWDKIADRMGDIIAAKLTGGRNGEFNFTFYDGNSGGKLEIKENK